MIFKQILMEANQDSIVDSTEHLIPRQPSTIKLSYFVIAEKSDEPITNNVKFNNQLCNFSIERFKTFRRQQTKHEKQ